MEAGLYLNIGECPHELVKAVFQTHHKDLANEFPHFHQSQHSKVDEVDSDYYDYYTVSHQQPYSPEEWVVDGYSSLPNDIHIPVLGQHGGIDVEIVLHCNWCNLHSNKRDF